MLKEIPRKLVDHLLRDKRHQVALIEGERVTDALRLRTNRCLAPSR